jgi:hypothetical protein
MRRIVPDNHNKFAIVVTRARVDPRVSVVFAPNLNGFGASPSRVALPALEKIL